MIPCYANLRGLFLFPSYPRQSGRHYIQGGFFGGTAKAIAWWTQTFYDYVNELFAKKEFVGKDQNLMTDLLYRHPDRFLVLRSDRTCVYGIDGQLGDPFRLHRSHHMQVRHVETTITSSNHS